MKLKLATIAFLLPLLLLAQQADPTYKPTSTPPEAVLLARADAQLISENKVRDWPASELEYTRYLWTKWGDPGSDELREYAQATAFGLANVSQADVFETPGVVERGRLLRVNLKHLCPKHQKEYAALWEAYQFDPSFSVLITPDQVRLLEEISEELAGKLNGQQCTVMCWESEGEEPRRRVRKRMKLSEAVAMKQADTLIRVNGHHLPAKEMVELQTMTKSLAPIVESGYFVYRGLSAIQDDGLYKDIYGGLYYDLSGIREMCKGKEKTDLDNFLASLGIVGGIKHLLEKGRADERAAMFRSNVIGGRPRLVFWFLSPSSRASVNRGLVVITRDLKMKRVDIGTHAMMNLDDFPHDATEILFELPSGLIGYVLFDGNDKLQDEAPFDVVVDRTVPEPHCPRLQSAISCIRCHGTNKEAMGWQPVANDVKTLSKHIGVFGDISKSQRNKNVAEVLDRLKRRYLGDPDRVLRQARDDYMAGVLRVTGPWKNPARKDGRPQPGDDQTDVVVRASAKLAEIYSKAWYDGVTPQAAMADLGFAVSEERAAAYMSRLLPPVEKSGGISPEDVRIAGIRAGITGNRFDWNMVSSFAAARSQATVAAWKAAKK